jgi:galactosylxylosylprotein 3-beta-galactosyltransferase
MSAPEKGLRFFGAGDASFGAWMLAFNVTHWEDRRMCSNDCSETNILGLYHTTRCNGLCKPEEDMLELHRDVCGAEPTIPRGQAILPESRLHSYDPSKEKCHRVRPSYLNL